MLTFSSQVLWQYKKLSKENNGKFNLNGFHCFERIRGSNSVEIYTLANNDLYPILVHCGSDANEILTIEVQ